MRQQYIDAIVALETCEDSLEDFASSSPLGSTTGSTTGSTKSITKSITTSITTSGESERAQLYKSRSNEGGLLGRSQYASAPVDTSVISTTSGYADVDAATRLAHFSLTPQQHVLLRAFHVLRALAIDIRLFVPANREVHL